MLAMTEGFLGRKDTGDYHNEMNTSHSKEWFEHRLCLTVLINPLASWTKQVPQHSRGEEPHQATNKKKLLGGLTEKSLCPT